MRKLFIIPLFLFVFNVFALDQSLDQDNGKIADNKLKQATGPSASYGGRIQARIKPNITFDPSSISGNPAAEVEVRCAPDGTIIYRKLIKSSGFEKWDIAVLKAIDKTEILPRDVDGRVHSPLLLRFVPNDGADYSFESNSDEKENYLKSMKDAKLMEQREKERIKAEEEKSQRQIRIKEERIRLHKIASDNAIYGISNMGIHINRTSTDVLGMLIVEGSVRNNLDRPVFDILIRCRHFAQSGTELRLQGADSSATIYQKWAPSEIRYVRFKIGNVDQRDRTSCEVVNWKG